jgi:predicted CoA-binding protein
MATPLENAREFLSHRRIAVVGLSRNPQDMSRVIFRELAKRGFDVVGVNPAIPEADGRPCVARVQDVRPPPDGALLFTPPALTERVVRDCAEAGVRRVWMHRGAGHGAASPAAVAFCDANGIAVVRDLCPYLALPGSAFPHRVHGFFRRIGARAHAG